MSFIILRAILNEDFNRYLNNQGIVHIQGTDTDKDQGTVDLIQLGDEFSLWT